MAGYQLVVAGGRLVDPANGRDELLDIGIAGGKVVELKPHIPRNHGEQVIDATGYIVIPGLVDTHVHVAREYAYGAGYRALVRAGVTTAADLEGPVEIVKRELTRYGCGVQVGVLEALYPRHVTSPNPSTHQVRRALEHVLTQGAMGVKIIGGHRPMTPEATRVVIEETTRAGALVAFHVGTTATGSSILGLEEACDLAGTCRVQVAHVNAYCRGIVAHPLEEVRRAIDILEQHQNLVGESHLAPFNGTSARCEGGIPVSHVTRTCLERFGYPASADGIRQAILDGRALVYARVGYNIELLSGDAAVEAWERSQETCGLSFPVNLPVVATALACWKDDRGEFVVPALSSDGGVIPRNIVLRSGLALVELGALTISEFVLKACYNGAAMLGLHETKGHLGLGADADLVVVDLRARRVAWVVVGGEIVFSHGVLIERPGRLITLLGREGSAGRAGLSCLSVAPGSWNRPEGITPKPPKGRPCTTSGRCGEDVGG